jgi:hypothetical protein
MVKGVPKERAIIDQIDNIVISGNDLLSRKFNVAVSAGPFISKGATALQACQGIRVH